MANQITDLESQKADPKSNENKLSTKIIPKQEDEIITLDDIAEDLRYLTQGYPVAAVKAALSSQHEVTPILFEFLEHALKNYEQLDDFYFGHLHALFLLAYFREKTAFPLVMQIASLPGKWPDNILGDTITEDFDRIIASIYDGNISLIQQLIEDKEANTWSRSAAIRSLLVLMRNNLLERDWVITYFKRLFDHPAFVHDDMATTHIVLAAAKIYPEELHTEIKMAYENDRVDTFCIGMEDIDDILTQDKEKRLTKYFYENSRFDLINDVIADMEWWHCFHAHEQEEDDDRGKPYRRELAKIGRNEPCPCGSGKKFKKCCLS